jgi:hypothetical protein
LLKWSGTHGEREKRAFFFEFGMVPCFPNVKEECLFSFWQSGPPERSRLRWCCERSWARPWTKIASCDPGRPSACSTFPLPSPDFPFEPPP